MVVPDVRVGQVETQRLVLRPLRSDDVDELLALDADPEVMRYITGGRPTPREEVVRTVRTTRDHRWTAVDRSTGAFIGWFALAGSGADQQERELGYRLCRRAWGNGYATEGARALIDVAFTRLGARQVWAQTMAVNTRSRRVLERCGLRYVRTFHLDWDPPIEGTEHGDVEYELLRSEWEDRH